MFLIAGWFSARSLVRKGAGAFAPARLLPLGVPLMVFIFLIGRLAAYLCDLGQDQHPSLAHYWGLQPESGGPYEAGPMWFVAALLVRRWSGAQVMVS